MRKRASATGMSRDLRPRKPCIQGSAHRPQSSHSACTKATAGRLRRRAASSRPNVSPPIAHQLTTSGRNSSRCRARVLWLWRATARLPLQAQRLESPIAQGPAQLAVNVLLVLGLGGSGAGIGGEHANVVALRAQVFDRGLPHDLVPPEVVRRVEVPHREHSHEVSRRRSGRTRDAAGAPSAEGR